MRIQVINDEKNYIFKKWLATKVVFWILQLFCLITAIHFVCKFAVKQLDFNGIVHGVGLSALSAALLLVPLSVEKIFKWYIPNPIVFCVFFLVVANVLVGEVWNLFNLMPFVYDTAMHTFNGGLFMFFGFSLLGMLNSMPKKNMQLAPIFCVLFAFAFAMLIEYMWEIYEFTLDSLTFSTNMQRWKDSIEGMTADGHFINSSVRGNAIVDTMKDIIVHAIGAIPVCVYSFIMIKKQSCDWILRTSILSKKQVKFIKSLNEQKEEEKV